MIVKAALQGPTITIATTSAIVCGSTSGYLEYAAIGPIRVLEAAVFASTCVMHGGSEFAPSSTITYPAGYPLAKFFTTIQLTSGSVEGVPLKSLPTLENS